MNIYVGNLAFGLSDDRLREVFAEFGEVTSAHIIMDRETNRSRGFGFVEMSNEEDGNAAIEGLNGSELDGRTLKVNEARPRQPRNSNQSRQPRRW